MPNRTVVCDTSPLFYLHQVGSLDLLRSLYGRVFITPQVQNELRQGDLSGENIPDITTLAWLDVKEVRLPEQLEMIADLGAGEASVLALALSFRPDVLVIMDDKLGRRMGKMLRLSVTGTAGVLLKAKEAGHIKSLALLLDQMINQGLWLTERVKQNILSLAGETHLPGKKR